MREVTGGASFLFCHFERQQQQARRRWNSLQRQMDKLRA
jgi:hypothetical protein